MHLKSPIKKTNQHEQSVHARGQESPSLSEPACMGDRVRRQGVSYRHWYLTYLCRHGGQEKMIMILTRVGHGWTEMKTLEIDSASSV
jgi:hypothetical protein